jgi:hypothetical protein
VLIDKETFVPGAARGPGAASRALRIGISLRPEVVDRMEYFDDHGNSCALAAMYEGLTGKHLDYSLMDQKVEVCERLELILPVDTIREIGNMFIRGHSRESIAKWLEAKGL